MGRLPEHWSATRHRMFYRCGEQYRRRYVDGERVPPNVAMIGGSAVDDVANENFRRRLRGESGLGGDEARDLAATFFRRRIARGGHSAGGQYEGATLRQAEAHARGQAIDLAGLHAELVAPRIRPTAVQLRIEVPASDALPVPFVSIPDVVDAGAVLRDTKTTQAAPKPDVADADAQLTGQWLAFSARYRRPPESAQLDFLVRTPSTRVATYVPRKTTRTASDLAAFLGRIRRAVDSIEREVFLPAPEGSPMCSERWCGYARTCPFFLRTRRPTS